MPLHSDVHVDRPLSNFAVEYRNEAFIASQVAPFVPVNNKSDTYMTYNKADKFSLPKDLRGPKDEANQITWGTSTGTYACLDRALKDFLSDAVIANSDAGINPQQRTVGLLTDLLLLGYEKRVADLVFGYGNYATTGNRVTLTGTDQFSDYAGSDPIGVIDTAKAACFVEPNTMIMGVAVYNKLKRHPALLAYVSGGATTNTPGMISLATMAEIFEIPRILIGKSKYNASMKGQTATYSKLWGSHVVVAFIDPAVTLDNLSAFKTFRWNQITTDAGFKVRRYRDEKRGGGGEEIEAEMSVDEAIICEDVAYIVKDAIA